MLFAVHEHRGDGRLTGSGQADADIGLAAFTGPVHHAAHHRERQALHAGVAELPFGHALSHERLDILGQRLEEGAGGPAATLQQHSHGSRRGNDALAAHAGLRETQVKRIIAARGQSAIDRDQVLHVADLAAEYDPVVWQAQFLGLRGALEGRADQGLAHHRRSPTMVANWSSRLRPKPTLPGLIRYLARICAHSGTCCKSWWPL